MRLPACGGSPFAPARGAAQGRSCERQRKRERSNAHGGACGRLGYGLVEGWQLRRRKGTFVQPGRAALGPFQVFRVPLGVITWRGKRGKFLKFADTDQASLCNSLLRCVHAVAHTPRKIPTWLAYAAACGSACWRQAVPMRGPRKRAPRQLSPHHRDPQFCTVKFDALNLPGVYPGLTSLKVEFDVYTSVRRAFFLAARTQAPPPTPLP